LLQCGARHIESVAMGTSHTVALNSKGEIYSWGWGDFGQLGNDKLKKVHTPQVLNPSHFQVHMDKLSHIVTY